MKYDPDDPRLTAYLLGELDEKERAALKAELAASETLRNELDEIRRTMTAVEQELESEPQFTLLDEQRDRIRRQFEFQRKRNHGRMKWFAAGGLSAAACLLLVVLLTSKQRTQEPQSPAEVALVRPATDTRVPEMPPPARTAGASEGKRSFETGKESQSAATIVDRRQSENVRGKWREGTVAANVPPSSADAVSPSVRDRFADSSGKATPESRNIAERADRPAAAPQQVNSGILAGVIGQDEKNKELKREEAQQRLNKSVATPAEDRSALASEAEAASKKLLLVGQGNAGMGAGIGGGFAAGRASKASPVPAGHKVLLARSELHVKLAPGVEKLNWVIGVQAAAVTEAELSVMQVRYSDQSLKQLSDWPSAGMSIAAGLIEINAGVDSPGGLLVYVRAPAKTRVVVESLGKAVVDMQLSESLLVRNGVLLQERVEGLQSLLKPAMFSGK
ncbi:MAG TPA: hypothetical protein VGK99_08510 [Acidobacteriota bacterium]|jgi:hypothetical protein